MPRATVPAPWPARDTARRAGPAARALVAGLACALLLPLLAAWAIPPALDWGRFRTGIAAIAAAQLGRPVVISGEVTLRLLPEAVLTATGVMLPDQGDGVSAALTTLRLQVAVLPLLAGRITPRDLVLGAPVVQLPWPLPDSLVRPAHGRVPHAFAAHIENGTLRVGRVQIAGINAGIHDGPEPSAIPGLLPEANAAGFGAEGFAAFAGRSWRFTGALGVPDADGVAALDLAVRGQGVAARTNGTVQGTVSEGVVQGQFHAGGPDLSVLMPAARLAWQADTPFVASGASIEAGSIKLALGGSPAEASLSVHVAAPARLDGRVHAASLDLDSWFRVLGTAAGLPATTIPGRIDIFADTANLFGGTATGLHGALVSDGESIAVDHAGATLPGRAKFEISGTIIGRGGLMRIGGPVSLDAPDLRTTLRWAHGLAPALLDALPAGVLHSGALTGIASAGADTLSVARLAGQVDGTGVAGDFRVGRSAHPSFGASLVLEHLKLDDWIGAGWSAPGGVARSGAFWSQFDGDLHVTAAEGSLRGVKLQALALDVHARPSGLRIDHVAAALFGMTMTASGMVGTDGALADGVFRAVAAQAATVQPIVPAPWLWTAGLLQGPAAIEATFAGPPGSAAVQIRADIGDLIAEAELRGDLDRRTAAGSITMRHPGAPRLLAQLGVSGAAQWLDTGSVAVRGQLTMQPGHVAAQDFDLVAANLRLGGSLTLDFAGAEPALNGVIDAETLALPGWQGWARSGPEWLRGWSAQLRMTAGLVTVDGFPVAQSAHAALGLGSGIALVDLAQASAFGGTLAGQLAIDAGRATPTIALHGRAVGLNISGPLSGWPVDLVAGQADGIVDADMTGDGPLLDRLAGTATVALRSARLSGLDLVAARRAAASHGRLSRPALLAALSEGVSDGVAGTAKVEAAHGSFKLVSAELASEDGAIVVQGTADRGGLAMKLQFASAGASVEQAGPWGSIKATPALGGAKQGRQATEAAPVARPKRKHG